MSLNLKNETMDKVPKKKTVSVTFSHAVFSLLSTYGDLVMQDMVWFGASYANLRQLHIQKHQIQVKKTCLTLE